MIRRIYSVRCTERAEHLGRQLEIQNVNDLVARKTEFAPRHPHHDRVPLAIILMTKHRCFKQIVERIVGLGTVRIKAIFKKFLFCHRKVLVLFFYRQKHSCLPFILGKSLLARLPFVRHRYTDRKKEHGVCCCPRGKIPHTRYRDNNGKSNSPPHKDLAEIIGVA